MIYPDQFQPNRLITGRIYCLIQSLVVAEAGAVGRDLDLLGRAPALANDDLAHLGLLAVAHPGVVDRDLAVSSEDADGILLVQLDAGGDLRDDVAGDWGPIRRVQAGGGLDLVGFAAEGAPLEREDCGTACFAENGRRKGFTRHHCGVEGP